MVTLGRNNYTASATNKKQKVKNNKPPLSSLSYHKIMDMKAYTSYN